MKIVIISTYLPSKCGIATHTHDLRKALLLDQSTTVDILAIAEYENVDYTTDVKLVITKHEIYSYEEAAIVINENYDCCILQHEYGIFGGESGDFVLKLTEDIKIPILTIFHTILQKPSTDQHLILQKISAKSSYIVVMTAYAVGLLIDLYGVPTNKISHIPHGVPLFNFDHAKAKSDIGITDKVILLSFGFLGRGKGFETAIQAVATLPHKKLIYIILGTTHPNVLKHEGETYRDLLIQKCKELEVDDQVLFINEFASEETLVKYLTACDIYVTPYPNEDQISSGTLSFAIGAGAAVVSTPYIYAKDILNDDIGLLFPFNDSTELSNILYKLIENPAVLKEYRMNAKNIGLTMQWPAIGKKYLQVLHNISD